MTDLPRLRPDPIPAIHPLPEYLATGRVRERYDDMKAVFQVPWMGVVTMAYAHYPSFYDSFWAGLRPLFASRPFVAAFQDLRAHTEDAVAALAPPPIVPRLRDLGYAPREIDGIRAMVEVFSHGNFPYLLVATTARLLLEGGELGGTQPCFCRHLAHSSALRSDTTTSAPGSSGSRSTRVSGKPAARRSSPQASSRRLTTIDDQARGP
jgi:hypothetical protein